MDALKNFMTTMTDTILQQVTDEEDHAGHKLHKATTFDYLPTARCESSHRHAPIGSLRRSDETPNGFVRRPQVDSQILQLRSHYTQLIPAARLGLKNESKPKREPPGEGTLPNALQLGSAHVVRLYEVQSMTIAPKLHNTQKHYEFHEQNGHTTDKYRELKKALHVLADTGQIDQFLKGGPQFLRKELNLEHTEPQEECSIKIVATIVSGYAKGITRLAQKAQIRGTQQVVIVEQGSRITVPTIVFHCQEGPHLLSPHTNPLVVELKVANALIHQILIDTEKSIEIITWVRLKRLKHPRREIIPLVHPFRGFGGQEVNPTGLIQYYSSRIRSRHET
ncbi:LOW QUALITY PROTEIN: hypothetical protein Cgig2_018072 [Carnegiea gigantea]|uniref:Uncharacterized protein n=1 Tax=Carnegiea gigantea TaxID=171969 RepID=A0A9Q1K9D5_9CARY|nr:LOW QUALITY PROTEIN: hypothetical protein Cgig2_018072 [Carnegiea gigantea]